MKSVKIEIFWWAIWEKIQFLFFPSMCFWENQSCRNGTLTSSTCFCTFFPYKQGFSDSVADKVNKDIVRDISTNISNIMKPVWKLTEWILITKQRPEIPQTWPQIHGNLGLFSKEISLISTIEVFQVQTFTVTLLLHIQSHWKCIQVVHKCTSVVEEVLRPLIQ